jgi:hypothetical protein
MPNRDGHIVSAAHWFVKTLARTRLQLMRAHGPVGINGLVALPDGVGEFVIVGAGMNGSLPVARLNTNSQGAQKLESNGANGQVKSSGPALESEGVYVGPLLSAYDIDVYNSTSHGPLLCVVSPNGGTLVTVVSPMGGSVGTPRSNARLLPPDQVCKTIIQKPDFSRHNICERWVRFAFRVYVCVCSCVCVITGFTRSHEWADLPALKFSSL